jgi:phage tail-like protein
MSETSQFRGHDPLRVYQFRVVVPKSTFARGSEGNEDAIAGVQRVSGLAATVGASETWSGGNNLHRYANPERVTWDPVTLESGIALDLTLVEWAEAVRQYVATGKKPDKPLKRTVYIDLWDPHPLDTTAVMIDRPSRAIRYVLKNAWISKFQAYPRLDATSSEVAISTVELVHEGFERFVTNTAWTESLGLTNENAGPLSAVLGFEPIE